MRAAFSRVATLVLLGGCCDLGSAVGAPPAPSSEAPVAAVETASAAPPVAAPGEPAGEAEAIEPSTAIAPAPSAEGTDPAAGATITHEVAMAEMRNWRDAEGGILGDTEISVAPSESGGGVRIFGVAATDPMAALGFQNGDIIHTLNGMSVSDEERLRGAFEQLRVTSYFRAEIIRRGTHETLYVAVRE